MNLSRRMIGLTVGTGLLLAVAVAVPQSLIAQERGLDRTGQLIQDLGNDSFDTRRQARESLVKMGRKAVPALTATALDKTKETGYSAVRILSRMMNELSGEDAAAAKSALQKIAKGEDTIARQAREAVEEAAQVQQRRQRRPGIQQMPGGGMQFQLGGNGNTRSSQTSIINGVVSTKVTEPGRTVEIKKDPNGQVVVTVTDEGKKPKTWSAKSAEELKTKHPEAHKLLQQYSGRVGRMAMPMDDFFNMNMDDIMGMQQMMIPRMGRDPFGGADPFEQFRRRRAPRAPQVSKEVQ
ncbi:MAG: hypothetical protein AB8G99_07090, partial [Planctomycetaceae bacterium]